MLGIQCRNLCYFGCIIHGYGYNGMVFFMQMVTVMVRIL